MDSRLLQQFVALSETLHFARASELCHISPSALSRSIQQLEGEVGVPLFDRDNRSVRLTPAGSDFLGYARDALEQWDLMRHRLQEDAGELQGEVRMYCSVTASYSFLFDLLSRVRADHPRIEIKLHTGDPENATALVLSGDADIAIGARPDTLAGALAFWPIATSPLVFIAARGNEEYGRLEGRTPVPEAWARTPMILSERGLSRRRVDRWFAGHGLQPNIYAQVAGNEAIVSMVSLGFGVGVVPRIVLDNSPLADKVSVLELEPELEPYEVGLFTLEKKLRNPLISAFWAIQKSN
jgi:LysR family positive regulator for ilvC